MKRFKITLPEYLQPYRGILAFFVILFVTHFFWKLTMNGDETDNEVYFFGLELTNFFNFTSTHVARISYSILHFFNPDPVLYPGNIIKYSNGEGVRIIWACTGIKQAYIFAFIILLYRGNWKRKLWYIPLGLLVVYVFNIFRITFITALIEDYPQYFDLVHGYLLKYLFYIVIFVLWVIWDEKISGNTKLVDKK